MRKILLLAALLLSFYSPNYIHAQVVASYTVTGSGVTLSASLPTASSATPAYPFPGSADDLYSTPVSLGFTFNYYGNNYSQCRIGPNGCITFNSIGYNNWTIDNFLLGNTDVLNTICGVWCDMLVATNLTYYTDGTAPFRRFIVSYCATLMSHCGIPTTSTIVLHETTNEIDIYVGRYTACVGWNNGRAIEGIQNATGTAATVVPGRDYPSVWSAFQSAHRFTPVSGGATYTLSPITYDSVPYNTGVLEYLWYDNSTGAYVGSGNPLSLPSFDTAYTVRVAACRDTFSVGSTVCTGVSVTPSITCNVTTACDTTSVVLSVLSPTSFPGLVYQWQSSPDSMTWTDIPGAGTSPYTLYGIMASTYFRVIVSCPVAGGSSMASAGILVYHPPSCSCPGMNAGVPLPDKLIACSLDTIVLNDTGYSISGGTPQWQSSPDSVTWTNITGANTIPYTFTGLSASMFYRLTIICPGTGSVVQSTGVKIEYVTICPCVPLYGGAAYASPPLACSTTIITLNDTNYITSGTIYQWQGSLDSITWSDISSPSVPYVFSGLTATTFYRLKITCIASGIVTFSSASKVTYYLCPTMDIPALFENQQINLYPNPGSEKITIDADANTFRSFVLTDLSGRKLIEGTIDNNLTTVNIKTLSSGIYYIILYGENGNTTQKLIKW